MSDKSMDTILSNLKELGFTEYEAKVYMSLINEHPLSAYNVSKNSGVPHSRVYDITRYLSMLFPGIRVVGGVGMNGASLTLVTERNVGDSSGAQA